MFPVTDDAPSLRGQDPVDSPVTSSIPSNLLYPKLSVGCRNGSTESASMPKTSIDENRDSLAWKKNVRVSKHFVGIRAPSACAVAGEDRTQP